MTTMIKNADVRTIQAGILVSRAANTSPLATANLFAITGGRILLRMLLGEVTVAIQAQATTVKFTNTPTLGAATDMSSAISDLNALQIGGRIAAPIPAAAATAITLTAAGVYTNVGDGAYWTVIPVGIISVTYGAASTGAIKYDLLYTPLDVGAQVAAL